jgi:hypothetical protein
VVLEYAAYPAQQIIEGVAPERSKIPQGLQERLLHQVGRRIACVQLSRHATLDAASQHSPAVIEQPLQRLPIPAPRVDNCRIENVSERGVVLAGHNHDPGVSWHEHG